MCHAGRRNHEITHPTGTHSATCNPGPERTYVHRSLSLLLCPLLSIGLASGETIPARHRQGSVHAMLLIYNEAGKLVGVADDTNVARGKTWVSRLTMRFRDGSLDDETTVYTQGKNLRVVSDHHIQKGPSFPKPIDTTVNAASGNVTWHEMKDGKDEVKTDHMDLPLDLANGLLPLVIQNFPSGVDEVKVGYVASAPKPRLIKLAISRDGQSGFTIGGERRKADTFKVHFELGGIVGVIAPIIGKDPGDLHIWALGGDAPTFIRMNGELYNGGTVYDVELSGPSWAKNTQPTLPAK
ncbi:hypothetical protein Terro_4015 [Terriglobus roseus DSM 18391]|uniref:DUF3108 domain-containing protein n=2 Tax=Terriglobus roseus TaxID=392734 RepID=I3ZLV5_TERRK|nr:hypothetical protein Terro_4015 [Terriglobus roseus DSM 18391]